MRIRSFTLLILFLMILAPPLAVAASATGSKREFPRVAAKKPIKARSMCIEPCDPFEQDPPGDPTMGGGSGLRLCEGPGKSKGTLHYDKICRSTMDDKDCFSKINYRCDKFTFPDGFSTCATCL